MKWLRPSAAYAARWKTYSNRCAANSRVDQAGVGHAALDKLRARRQILAKAPRQVVQHHDLAAAGEQVLSHVRADEAGPAGHEHTHVTLL